MITPGYGRADPIAEAMQMVERYKVSKDRIKHHAGSGHHSKMEFSKIIFIGVSGLTVAVTAFACIMVWRTNDTTPLQYLIPAVFAEAATATGYYYHKSKVENAIKLNKIYGTEAVNQAESDATISNTTTIM